MPISGNRSNVGHYSPNRSRVSSTYTPRNYFGKYLNSTLHYWCLYNNIHECSIMLIKKYYHRLYHITSSFSLFWEYFIIPTIFSRFGSPSSLNLQIKSILKTYWPLKKRGKEKLGPWMGSFSLRTIRIFWIFLF